MKSKAIAAVLSAAALTYCFSNTLITNAVESDSSIPAEATEFDGSYYMVYNERLSWLEAELFCESLGGHLVTITSQEEQDFIESINSAKKWIGGYRHTGWDNTWYWVTSEEWDYTNWAEGEPNNSSNVISNENKAAVWPLLWNDLNLNSSEQYGFICEWDEYSVTHVNLGYVNNDGAVDALDASDILRAYALKQTIGDWGLTETQFYMADVDKNNYVDAIDASIVLTYYAHTATDTDDDNLWHFEVTVK